MDAVVDVLLPTPTPSPPHASPYLAAQLPRCANLKQEDVLFWFILVVRTNDLKIAFSSQT